MTNTRVTNAQLAKQVADLTVLVTALLDGKAPAKTATSKTPARKTAARKAPTKKAPARKPAPKKDTKGDQTFKGAGGTLTRTEWNNTLSAKARLAGNGNGKSTYRTVVDQWADARQMMLDGKTPNEALAALI